MSTLAHSDTSLVPKRNTWAIASWVFMRISGVLLLFLALGHFAIMHVFNDVHNLNLQFVEARWALLSWRAYDAALLALALIHGLNGARIITDDYVLRPWLNRTIKAAIFVVGAFLIVLGTVTIIGGVRVPS